MDADEGARSGHSSVGRCAGIGTATATGTGVWEWERSWSELDSAGLEARRPRAVSFQDVRVCRNADASTGEERVRAGMRHTHISGYAGIRSYVITRSQDDSDAGISDALNEPTRETSRAREHQACQGRRAVPIPEPASTLEDVSVPGTRASPEMCASPGTRASPETSKSDTFPPSGTRIHSPGIHESAY